MAVHDLSLYLKSDRSSFNLLVHVVSEAELSPKDIVARNTIISIIMIIDTKVTYRDQERNFCCRILFTILIQASFYHVAQQARRKSKILDRKRCTFFCCHDRSHRSPAKSVLPLNAAACFVVATYEMMKKDNIIIILLLMLGEDIIGVGCWRLHRSASHTQLWVGGDRRWSLRILTTIPKSDPTPIPQLFCLSPLQISPSAKHLSPLKRLTRESSVDLSPPKSRLAKILYPPGGQFDLFHLY